MPKHNSSSRNSTVYPGKKEAGLTDVYLGPYDREGDGKDLRKKPGSGVTKRTIWDDMGPSSDEVEVGDGRSD